MTISMDVDRMWLVRCDVCPGSEASGRRTYMAGDTAEIAMARAAQIHGWEMRDGKVVCRVCASHGS